MDVTADLSKIMVPVTGTATVFRAEYGVGAGTGSDVEAAPLTADANYCKRRRGDKRWEIR